MRPPAVGLQRRRARIASLRRARPRAPRTLLALVVLALLPAAGCAHRTTPPSAATPPSRPLRLTGQRVMVLPAQPAGSVSGDLAAAFDAELAYWLADRAPRVHWITAAEIERLTTSSPALRIDPHELDVAAFGRMRVERIGDPLFGEVHNLGGVLDASLALIPASVAYVPPPAPDSAGGARGPGHIEVTAALISTFGGEVVWFGVLAGEPGAIDAPAAVGTAARALARALLAGD
jgi:hypothetical protein